MRIRQPSDSDGQMVEDTEDINGDKWPVATGKTFDLVFIK